jgi:hypothetical protein
MNMTVVRWKSWPVLLMALFAAVSARGQELDLVGDVSWDKFGRGIRIFSERIDNNRTTGSSGFLRLQIWATDDVYDGVSDITGYVLGTFNLGPLQSGFSFVNVARTVRFFRPPAGVYFTTITLEEEDVDGNFLIIDSENFEGAVNFGGYGAGNVEFLETNGDVGFFGEVSWLAGNGRVQFFAEEILNERESGRSGVLRVKLWATSTPYNGGTVLQGYPMASKRVGRVTAGFFRENFSKRAFFRPPPPGEYYVTMTLEELVRGKWEIVDYATYPDLNLF